MANTTIEYVRTPRRTKKLSPSLEQAITATLALLPDQDTNPLSQYLKNNKYSGDNRKQIGAMAIRVRNKAAFIGWSICSSLDDYKKEYGRQTACGRLTEMMENSSMISSLLVKSEDLPNLHSAMYRIFPSKLVPQLMAKTKYLFTQTDTKAVNIYLPKGVSNQRVVSISAILEEKRTRKVKINRT